MKTIHLEFPISNRPKDENGKMLPLDWYDKECLEAHICAVIPTFGEPVSKWFFLDDIFRDMRARLPDEKRYNYYLNSDVKNALRRLERRGVIVSNRYVRGWFVKKRYAYALPF